jgi:4-hydroxy-tetrahydrodipicolinate synthase
VKAALQLIGWSVGPPRSPLVSLNSEMKEELLKILSSMKLI